MIYYFYNRFMKNKIYDKIISLQSLNKVILSLIIYLDF